ncbi:hypothetical protein [Tomitella biformata]|uniref:hypothetical protein n=1 Tax=Tomitella biformata TaxID=630403 RepID=UPI000466A794|nr:hypothetical protein [Tomitella biformata]
MAEEQDIAAADWTDQDLLTRELAAERLVEEMAKLRVRKSELEALPGDDPGTASSLALVSRRLTAMENVHKTL